MPRDSQKSRWTAAQLHEMASSKRDENRKRVGYSREAMPEILKFLSGQRRNVRVCRIVAAHPYTPHEALWALADDNDVEVRQAFALNQSSPAELFAHLAGVRVDPALLVAMTPDVPIGSSDSRYPVVIRSSSGRQPPATGSVFLTTSAKEPAVTIVAKSLKSNPHCKDHYQYYRYGFCRINLIGFVKIH